MLFWNRTITLSLLGEKHIRTKDHHKKASGRILLIRKQLNFPTYTLVTPVKASHELGGFRGFRWVTPHTGKQKWIPAKQIHLDNKSFFISCNGKYWVWFPQRTLWTPFGLTVVFRGASSSWDTLLLKLSRVWYVSNPDYSWHLGPLTLHQKNPISKVNKKNI